MGGERRAHRNVAFVILRMAVVFLSLIDVTVSSSKTTLRTIWQRLIKKYAQSASSIKSSKHCASFTIQPTRSEQRSTVLFFFR